MFQVAHRRQSYSIVAILESSKTSIPSDGSVQKMV